MVETLVVVEKRNTKTADVVIERDSINDSSRRVASFDPFFVSFLIKSHCSILTKVDTSNLSENLEHL